MQLVAEATGRNAAVLLKATLDKTTPAVEKRRILPLKHVQLQAGYAAVLTWLLQQRPCPLALSPVCTLLLPLSCSLSLSLPRSPSSLPPQLLIMCIARGNIVPGIIPDLGVKLSKARCSVD